MITKRFTVTVALVLFLAVCATPPTYAGDQRALEAILGTFQAADNSAGMAAYFAQLHRQAAANGWAEGAQFFRLHAGNFKDAAANQWGQASGTLATYQQTYGDVATSFPALIQYQNAVQQKIGTVAQQLQ